MPGQHPREMRIPVEINYTMIVSVHALQALFFLWVLSFPGTRAEVFWTYLPNPPLLHPVTWQDPPVPVYVNNTKILGLPSASHIWPQWSQNYTYMGISNSLPICFERADKNSRSLCTPVRRVLEQSRRGQRQSGIYLDLQYLYPIFNCNARQSAPSPPKVQPCPRALPASRERVKWLNCHANWSVCNSQICEWAPTYGDRDQPCQPQARVGRLWTANHRVWHPDIWKLVSGMGPITVFKENKTVIEGRITGSESVVNISVMACVPDPYVILVGKLVVKQDDVTKIFFLNCTKCALTNCVNASIVDPVALLVQPAFVFIPVNHTGKWYDDPGLEVLDRVRTQLIRGKRFIGLLIAGITALVVAIATAAASAIALSTGIQTAEFVNQLARNVTRTLETQEDWDRRIEQRLNALYDTVQLLGDEMVSLETRVSLKCHAAFRFMCVTPAPYNGTRFQWEKVKNHLNGIWHDSKTSLDLQLLHQEIQNLMNAPSLDIDIASQAQSFLQALRGTFPSFTLWGYHLGSLIGIGLLCLGGIFFLSCCVRLGQSRLGQALISLRMLQLQREKDQAPHPPL